MHVGGTLILAVCGCVLAHELGHVAHVVVDPGVELAGVELHPLRVPHTRTGGWPRALHVVVGGFVWGIGLPAAAWAMVRWLRPGWGWLGRYMLGMALIGNGAYLGLGWLVATTDGAELLRHGVPGWLQVGVGGPLAVAGLIVWHRNGGRLGMGEAWRAARGREAAVVIGLAVGMVAGMLIVDAIV